MSEGRSLSNVIAPSGAGSKWLDDRPAYNSLVESARSDTANVVAHQCFVQSATVCLASLGGAPASRRSRTFFALACTAAAVGPSTDVRLVWPVTGSM